MGGRGGGVSREFSLHGTGRALSAANHPNRRRGAGSREFSTHGTGRASRVVGRRWVCVVDAGPRRRAVRDRRTGRSRGGVGVRSADRVGRERHARVVDRAAGEKGRSMGGGHTERVRAEAMGEGGDVHDRHRALVDRNLRHDRPPCASEREPRVDELGPARARARGGGSSFLVVRR